MHRLVITFFLCFLAFSCKTISVNQKPQMLTETPVQLGSIGLLNGTVIAHSYESIAIPTIKKKLQVSLQPVSFSKQTFKAFEKANAQTKKIALTFSDSLKIKPEYLLLQFTDRVAMTHQLNANENTGLRSYLENKQDAQMITSVSIAFSPQELTALKNAEEIFLVQSSSKKFSLQTLSLDGKIQDIAFSKGIVFAYQTSSFCWKENNRHQLIITDIINGSEGCPPNTYRKASKAVQKNDFFKL